jgi:hypothetical protein
MAVTAPSPPVRTRTAIVVAALVVAGALGVRLADPQRVDWIRTYLVLFASLLIQALPFVMIGALAAALVEVFVPIGTLERLSRLPRPLRLPAAALAGLALPICECGSVPVARRLIVRGVHPAAGVAFMLAAPVINPVVLASTWVAYSGSGHALEQTVARAAIGLAVGAAAGLALRRVAATRIPVAPSHSHEQAGGRLGAVMSHLGSDFLFMGKFLVLGAGVSALIQTFVSRDVLDGLAGMPVLGTLAMMALAVLLSLCSEADAFVAVSFSSFGAGPQLAVLALGPVLDLKLAALYGATFGPRFTPRLLLVAVPIILVASILFEAVLT